NADVSIVVIGEAANLSGEANSRASLDLPGKQEQLVRAIKQTGKPFVIVLMNGRPLTIPWLAENSPAILESWFLGVEAGNAIADVLFGDVNPSGKLPVSFPRHVGQIPIYYNHKNTGRPPSGEQYTSKYLDVAGTPLYPFGFGLSYTSFRYDQLRLSSTKLGMIETLNVTVELKNTGSVFGEEVVQLYVRDRVGSVTRPVKELKGFQKIGLKAGESKIVSFTIKPDQLAFYNLEMKRVVEPGDFTVFVGGNSEDVLSADFNLN
ncbi:MAG TPA: glycoside hydrolase family 3 C-terminal domain-containing protein, partial [Acidobacteriota bacterium]|nr:glycoside hydrolase family 3 C-terminal domain-containing protein [Acidobacteriota bacterium]